MSFLYMYINNNRNILFTPGEREVKSHYEITKITFQERVILYLLHMMLFLYLIHLEICFTIIIVLVN